MENQSAHPTDKEQVYLNIDPYCGKMQLIHAESIAGSNLIIMANFSCNPSKTRNNVEVTEANFEIYPMFGLFNWGFKKIVPINEPKEGKRIIKFVMSLNGSPTMKVDFKGINWKADEIIDNEIKFYILGAKRDRSNLEKLMTKEGLMKPTSEVQEGLWLSRMN